MKTHKSKIEKILEKVRPYIKMHGGDVRLVGVKAGTVTLKISGTCANCPLADLTYNKMVGELIKQEVPQIKRIILV